VAVKLVETYQGYIGLSTDTKPPAPVGAAFYEEDTQKWFIRTSLGWVEDIRSTKLTGRHILSAGRQVATASDQAIVPTGGFNHICVVNDGTVELRLCIDGDSTLGVNIIYISAGESFDGYLAGSALHYSVASGTAAFRYVLS
jgi:hypothetical protein